MAFGAVEAMTLLAGDLPRFDEISIDERTLLYTIASAVIVTLLCGLFPALKNTRDAGPATQGSRTRVSSGQSSNWALVGVQIALSVTLLAGAGLLLRSFDALTRIDPGFAAERVLTFRLSGSFAETSDFAAVLQRIDRMLDELTALPGIEAAGTSFAVPGVPTERAQQELELVEAEAAPGSRLIAEIRTVSPSYFATLQIPLLAGELCRQTEGDLTQVVVNRSFAERYFPQRSVIGLHLAGNLPDRIVGIVGDAASSVPTEKLCRWRTTATVLRVRFHGSSSEPRAEPMSVTETVRARLNELEPLRSVYDIAPLDRRIGDVYSDNRLRTFVLTLFAAASLTLTCLGVYGTLSYIVSLRRREVGLRVALGALSSNIVSQFLLKALRVAGIACVIGLALSFALARALSGMLYGVAPSDPITLSSVVAIVIAVAFAAAWCPRFARRGSIRCKRLERNSPR